MAGRYQAYQEYRKLDYPFLDKLPMSWKVKPLKVVSNFRQGKLHEPFIHEDGKYICVNSRFVSTEGQKYKFCTKNLSPVNHKDILMVMSDLPNGRALAKALYVAETNNYALNQRVCAVTATKVNSRFLYYQLNRNDYFLAFDDGCNQTNLSNDVFKNYPVLIPTEEEQQKIANFLDHETAKIDTLIAKQEKLIELLKEKRQAVMSHAVTHGLNPDAPMKDSGVEWLGKVPEHWSVTVIKRCLEVKDGTHDTPKYVDKSETSFPLITSVNFIGDSIDFENAKYINEHDHLEIIKRSNAETGDVLMSMIGGNIGKALIIQDDANFSIKNVALFKAKGNLPIAKYLLYYLQSGLLDIQISLVNRGGAQGFLSLGDLRNLVYFKQPIPELNEIVNYLDDKVGKIDQISQKANSKILLLKERKIALISAAVTGKIDVRNWQVQ